MRYFFSRATSTTIDADDEADGIFARWADFGDWQVRIQAGEALDRKSTTRLITENISVTNFDRFPASSQVERLLFPVLNHAFSSLRPC